jgi:pimeloyl-ACP methyl ester carboxylesterase
LSKASLIVAGTILLIGRPLKSPFRDDQGHEAGPHILSCEVILLLQNGVSEDSICVRLYRWNEQWIEITGNASKPILVYLHGGPGGSCLPASEAWASWREYFNVADWDRRGAGRTFAQNGEVGCGRLTIDRILTDGIEIAEFLTSSPQQKRILAVLLIPIYSFVEDPARYPKVPAGVGDIRCLGQRIFQEFTPRNLALLGKLAH